MPASKHTNTYDVIYGLRTTGTTSELYTVERVYKIIREATLMLDTEFVGLLRGKRPTEYHT